VNISATTNHAPSLLPPMKTSDVFRTTFQRAYKSCPHTPSKLKMMSLIIPVMSLQNAVLLIQRRKKIDSEAKDSYLNIYFQAYDDGFLGLFFRFHYSCSTSILPPREHLPKVSLQGNLISN